MRIREAQNIRILRIWIGSRTLILYILNYLEFSLEKHYQYYTEGRNSKIGILRQAGVLILQLCPTLLLYGTEGEMKPMLASNSMLILELN
jgi:hypothetical protein